MKKFLGVLVAGVVLNLAGLFAVMPRSVGAAACANVSSFGAVTVSLPVLEHIKDRVIWLRMQSAEGDAKVQVEVNSADCLQIGGQTERSDTWQWFTVKSGQGDVVPYTFTRHDGNMLKIIGVKPGVRVDKVLVTDSLCVPQDFGNNCQAGGAEMVVAEEQDFIILPQVSGPIQGRVKLSDTPERNRSQLKEVSYRVAGQVVQRSADGIEFDTNRVKNGTHTVYITTMLQDGSQIKEQIVVEIKNPENPFTAFVRWAKLNQQGLKIGLLIIIGIVVLLVLARLALARRKKRRVRLFHGL